MGVLPSKRAKELPADLEPSLSDDGLPLYGHLLRQCRGRRLILTLLRNGKVIGLKDPAPESLMEFTYAGVSEVRIKAVQADLYLAINRDGKLYGERDAQNEETVFLETRFASYNTYLSKRYAYMGWFINLTKNGKPKNASKTKWGQPAIRFLPLTPETMHSPLDAL